MSEKRKFSKLRLPASKRGTSRSQISKFFAHTQSENNNLDNENSSSNPNTLEYEYEILTRPNPAAPIHIIDIPEDASKSSLQSFEYTSAKEIKHQRLPARSTSQNTIKEFFNQSTSENDFEILNKVGRKAVRKPVTATQRKKSSAAGSSKKQPKIKSLLQKEQLLSDFIAEQSFAEHIDPNEMQLALVLSRSEVETCRIENDQGECNGNSNSTESIRQSLEQFGYKLNKNVKDKLSVYASNKSRTKWANKFTSLTMRNSVRQQEKANKKIETFLELQYTHVQETEHRIDDKFTMGSGLLSSMKSHQPSYLRHSFDLEPCDIGQFYVTDIIQPTTLNVGNLLKDFRAIPGRDLSPVKSKERSDVAEKASKELVKVSFPEKIELTVEPCSSRHEANERIVRQSSPDIFDDLEMEEFEDVEAISGTESTMKSLGISSCNSEKRTIEKLENFAMTTPGNVPVAPLDKKESLVFHESMAVETITILDSSNSNDVANEKFSHDQDTAKSAHPYESDDNTVDLTLEDDEEQHESQLINTPDTMSINSNEEQNQSQQSSSSLIILSDDEVNYSMKMITGLDIILNSSFQSVDKNTSNPSNAKKGINELCFEWDSQIDKESCCDSPAAGPSCMNYDGNIYLYSDGSSYNNKCTEATQATEITMKNYDKHNYTLAHEIMFDSFLEESEKYNMNKGFEQNITPPRTTTEEIQFLDLTQSCPKLTDRFEICPDLEDNTTSRQYNNTVKYSKSHSDSFLTPKTITPEPLKRFSSSRKFSDFAKNDSDFSDIDEFDRLVSGSPRKKQLFQYPQGLRELLTGNINSASADESFEEYTADSKTYLIKTKNVKAKPDYRRMDSPTRLNALYKYGLKPLKRKQALIMLEYIYNQTHPYVVDDTDEDHDLMDIVLNANDVEKECFEKEVIGKHNMFNLRDCFGTCLLTEDELRAEIEQEVYIFQTNRARVSTALLPLHVAWFNLIKSNEKLLEAVLCYVPIDLQEIYVFLKSIGYRYDPKDIKSFFDGRSIIFQYDLNKESTNRHVPKARSKLSQKSSKVA